MPAMHDIVHSAMLSQLYHKRDVWLRTLPFDMTHEECVRLVAPSNHVDILTQAAEYADVKSSQAWMALTVPSEIDGVEAGYAKVMLSMRTHAQKSPPLVPRAPTWQPTTREAGDKVIAWLTKRYEIGRRFGTAVHVLYRLNEACENGHQLRYMFPAVLHLCKNGLDTKMDKWMEKHAAYKPCKFTPAVSPELKKGIQDAGALLTACALMGEDVPEQPPGFVSISLIDMQAFRFNGSNVSRI